jgi:hypothetical protein
MRLSFASFIAASFALFIAAAFVAAAITAAPALAETRIFIIAADAGGYGIDRCLSTGARCGKAMAAAYCRAQAYAGAQSFRKVERAEITGAVPVSTSTCRGAGCADFIAIECRR